MAQNDNDLFQLRFTLRATLSLDWERILADPVWRQCAMEYEAEGLDVSDETTRGMVLQGYLRHYLSQERLLAGMPSTNGPGRIYDFDTEGT